MENYADFDVEAYANTVTGHGRTNRLLFVAQNSNGETQSDAFKLAIRELKKGDDIHAYANTVRAAHGLGLCQHEILDEAWIEAREQELSSKEATLENELKVNKSNIITDSIRLSFQDLGNFHYGRGALTEALKQYAKGRDYCTQSAHVWSYCMNSIRVALEMRNPQGVINNVNKAEQGVDLKNDAKAQAKLDAALGLCFLESRQFHKAAKKFTKVTGGSNFEWSDVVSPQEIAFYGVVCGLAYFSRIELRDNIINNVAFREFMETFPEVRELVNDFYNSKYSSCFSRLENLRGRLHIDMYLSAYAAQLSDNVRNKALVQYTSPFISVSLPKMASTFSTQYGALEADIVKLIQKGEIQARIDSGSQILYKKKADVRAETYKKVLATGEEYLRTTRALLIRASIQRFNLAHSSGGKGGRKGKGGISQQGPSIPHIPGPSGGFETPPGLIPLDEDDDEISQNEGSVEIEDSLMEDEHGLRDLEAETLEL